MLINRYDPEDVFARVPEVAAQTDPVLKHLDILLEDDELFQQVKADLATRSRYTLVHGRHSTPVEVILRMLICKHLYGWSFQETEERVKDSLVLRWFCRVYFNQVPDDTTLIRWAQTIRPETVHALNDRVVHLATKARVTKGRKLRVDATCVATAIHHPTDSGLLVDSVRTLSRFVQRAKPLVAQTLSNVKAACRSRLRSARRTAQSLHRLLRRKGEEKLKQQKDLYRRLIQTTQQMVQQAEQVQQALGEQVHSRAHKVVQRLLSSVKEVLPRIRQVIRQSHMRVLEDQKVPSSEKVLSLHEPHTRAIPRHKGGALVEFGREVTLDEVEGGIVTRFEINEQPNQHAQGLVYLQHDPLRVGYTSNLRVG